MIGCIGYYADSHSRWTTQPPAPGTPGGSEELIAKYPVRTQAYLEVRRGKRGGDNEGMRLKVNR